MIPLWSVLGLIAVVLILQALTAFRLARLRRARVYPEAGKATMSDVQRLLQNGLTGQFGAIARFMPATCGKQKKPSQCF